MSKYIPGNQKYLTLEDRIYIENSLNTGHRFKDIARYLCKDPTTILKRSGYTAFPTGIIKAPFIMQKTSAFIATTAERAMPAERLYYAA